MFSINIKNKNNFKKKKIISFIGKLNSAKGYDLFGDAIIKILDKYKDWKAIVIGDEPRENILFNHKNLIVKGYTKHDDVLKFIKENKHINYLFKMGRAIW